MANDDDPKKAKENEELARYLDKLTIASNDESKPVDLPVSSVPQKIPLQRVEYKKQARGPSPAELKKLISSLDAMTGKQLIQLCVEHGVSQAGPRKKQIARLDKCLRAKYARHVNSLGGGGGNRLGGKTAKHFDYLVVMDFECTCEEVILAYPHEIIEFPAVLIDVQQRKIIDQFRSFVRPKLNPILDPFCIRFTHITQSAVDNAPQFHEVVMAFQQWLITKGLGPGGHRFAFVTDGPHDLWKFFQHTCMVNDFEVPHDFRHFINIKKIFEMKYGHIEKGQGKPAIELMLQRVGIQFEGTKHCGLDDSINIAKIVIRMLEDNVELRINQRMTRVKNFTTIDSELINDLGRKDHAEWLKKLPLKLLSVKRDDFITETYLQCESCDEKEEQDR